MPINALNQTPAAPSPSRVASARPAAAPQAPQAGDQLLLTRATPPLATTAPLKRPPSTWIGIASGGAAVALAAVGLGAVTGLWLPILGTAAVLGGVLAVCGVGLTQGWGEGDAPRPFDKRKTD